MAEGYTLSGKCSGITPFGTAALEVSVIICDMENNCLREFDFQGNQKTQFILNGYTDCEQDSRVYYTNAFELCVCAFLRMGTA